MNFRPRDATWWIGAILAPGAVCFLVAPLPRFVDLVGPTADAWMFFVGSLFFTASGTLQLVTAVRERASTRGARIRAIDISAAVVQLGGMVFFNLSTYDATNGTLRVIEEVRRVWIPNLFGSIAFLIAGALSLLAARLDRSRSEVRTARVNFLGCIAFGISALAATIDPDTGDAVRADLANAMTSIGALCFLVGALRLVRG